MVDEPLLQLPAFTRLPRAEVRLLVRSTELVRLPAAQSVLLGTGVARELLVVVQGTLQALGADGWEAGPGEVLGAHALLAGVPQPHGFRCAGPALVAFAGVGQVRALLSGSPAFATAVAVSLSRELVRERAAVR